jgi:hypothetical protein
MALGIFVMLAWMALEVFLVLVSIGWGKQAGQWKDIEEPKYRMLLDLPMEDWPGREKPKDLPETNEPVANEKTER